MVNTPIDLSGLWKYNWDSQVLDDKRAKQVGHVRKDGTPAPHGTYTAIQYFRVRMGSLKELENGVVYIFDETGDAACFVWNGNDAWEGTADEVTFKVAANELLDKDIELKIPPGLLLARYDDPASCPINANVGARYVRRVDDPAAHRAEIAAQRIIPDRLQGTFRWTSGKDEDGLTFAPCYQQPRGQGEGAKTFGDTFLGDTKMAQVAFPFYGFNPSRMELYASTPQELTATGPGTPRAGVIETNPNQTFNGALVFAFPTDESKDYVRVEDLKDQPFLPLGLGGVPLDHKEELAHTEMVSGLEERMQSWSVTLGFSAGLDKLLDVGGEGSVHSKIEEQSKSECRYTVSRRVAKKWAILADLASHQLHDQFFKAVIGNTIALLSGSKPRWDDFVTSHGTHYAHAITQGSIEYAETRFSLKAETKAYLKGLDLKTESSAVVDGIKLKGTRSYSAEWGEKHGIEISKEDVASYSVGTDSPMGIFFDLRPLHELFSPVFFPYNPADTYGKLAPFVWHKARESFAEYLKTRAADKAREFDLSRNYTPRKFLVTFPSVSLSGPGNVAEWYGSITLADCGGNELAMLEVKNLNIAPGSKVHPGRYSPNAKAFYCTLAAAAGAKDLRFTITVDISADRVTLSPKLNIPIHRTEKAIGAKGHLVTLARAPTAQGSKEASAATVTIGSAPYSLEISVNAVEVGLLQ